MPIIVTYPETAFTGKGGNPIRPRMVEKEVKASSIVAQLIDFRASNKGSGNTPETDDPTGRTWSFGFAGSGSLSGPDTAALNAVVAAHTGVDAIDDSPSTGGADGQVWGVSGSSRGWITPAVGGGGSGDVVGPASAVDRSVPLFDGATGKLLEESAMIVHPTGALGVVCSTADTVAALRLVTTGANGGDAAVYSGDQAPEGIVSAAPGSTYLRSDGASSRIYHHEGATTGATGWVELGAAGGAPSGPVSPTLTAYSVGWVAIGGASTSLGLLNTTSSPPSTGASAASSYGSSTARAGLRCVGHTPLATANSACSGLQQNASISRIPLSTNASHSAFRPKFACRFAIDILDAANARFFTGVVNWPGTFSADPTASGSGMGARFGLGFGSSDSAEFHFIATRSGFADSVQATGVTATDGHVYHVEMNLVPNSNLVEGKLWTQTTFGGAWTLAYTYSFAAVSEILAFNVGMNCIGGNGSTAAASCKVYNGFMVVELL